MMFGLRQVIKRIFGGKQKSTNTEQSSDDIIRSRFKTKYWNFKNLLSINNTILESMSKIELALQGSQKFGMEFIRKNCTSISVNIYKLIKKINDISDDRYETLYHIFADIQFRIDQILEERAKAVDGKPVLSIEEINTDSASYTGSKMANLGEIMNLTGINVPHGFVITVLAYHMFLAHSDLQKNINQQLQSVNIEDIKMLGMASSNIQKLIMQSPVPLELEAAIFDGYKRLQEKTEKDVKVSMRSSALGEDSQESSFAGQYHTELNVSFKTLIDSYKKVIASKYSIQAITYRFNKGLRDEDIIMCVGCMAMVEAIASGVMYSKDPDDIHNDIVVINAVPGLGKAAVEGSVTPDLFVASKEQTFQLLKKEIHAKDQKTLFFSNKELQIVELPESDKYGQAITDEQVYSLVKQAVILENHFNTPQDIEWGIKKDGMLMILQSRPLQQIEKEDNESAETGVSIEVNNQTILSGGVAASPGVACGPAFIVNTAEEIYKFPAGAVLVAKNSLPHLATILNRSAAVVTDHGGIAGHLATVAREFGIPALFGTFTATKNIKNKAIITVDTYSRKVYEGKAEALLKKFPEKRISSIKDTPVYITLETILKHIAPLNLTDPKGNNFTPEGCQTYHDITRFCHEMAVKEMFDFGANDRQIKAGKQLVVDVPTQWWIIDLGDGFKGSMEKDTVRLENIASAPMLSLWEGMMAIKWAGPPSIDAGGLMSIMVQSTMNRDLCASGRSIYAQNNCAIISKNFC
ncbi:MAG: pyruvate, water dikinase, partial [Desulfobacterales bacterium]|nr:pyruvate, water dikinase [Desulfobacterales bacterium]